MSKSTNTDLAAYEAAARKEYGLEVLPPETADEAAMALLDAAAAAINEVIDTITKHEDAFEEATLEPRLIIGQRIAKAQELFTLEPEQKTAVARDAKALLSPVTTEPSGPVDLPGFSSWLRKEIPRLKRTTAIKYATAFRSLGLPLDAKPARIQDKIKDLRHHAGKNKLPMPTLNALYRQGKPNIPAPPDVQPSEADLHGEARVIFHTWRQTYDNAVKAGFLEVLDRAELLELDEWTKGIRDHLRLRIKTAAN